MKIEVLGMGCVKCNKLEENVKQALQDMGVDAEIDHVKDLVEISKRGVFMTPGLTINGKAVSQGKLLTIDQIKSLINKNI